ncbi:transmembrane protein, putative [Medicago truncatula]|uniref:Transmembrane protein, putative n=1 Tax=Medicago truncatula TaxID=3880 RepID=G7JWI0_MEDTR|nr:transmembrane protein, putative [Medicago truncatula]
MTELASSILPTSPGWMSSIICSAGFSLGLTGGHILCEWVFTIVDFAKSFILVNGN